MKENHNKRIRLKKELGQFFLRDISIANRIALSVPTEPLVVEIGPGDGALTKELINTGHKVIGVELDREMIGLLEQRFEHRRDFRLIHGNILKVDWEMIAEKADRLVVAGNLPYHLTSPILFNVFEIVRKGNKSYECALQRVSTNPSIPKTLCTEVRTQNSYLQENVRIEEMVIMVQREVGIRLTANSGCRDCSALTLLTRYHGTPEYLFTVPSDCFRPMPKVDGAVIKIVFHQADQFPDVDYNEFRRIVRGSFAQRRKMMRNALGVIKDLPEGWRDLDYDFRLRPEAFSFDDFVNLTNDLQRLSI
ncbi:MAG: rRNA adenine dimethyltransferase family protein [Candidatus Hatepunaea meridiana]|nr:rRNA adenine dimethyltransferase family protein [Candidatus Hatepunaea meridiana]